MRDTDSETEFLPYCCGLQPDEGQASDGELALLKHRKSSWRLTRICSKLSTTTWKGISYCSTRQRTFTPANGSLTSALSYLRGDPEYILWNCEEHPAAMERLVVDLQSPLVTKEACIHLTGEDSQSYTARHATLVELGMAELIYANRRLLAERLRAIDFAFLRLDIPAEVKAGHLAISAFRQSISSDLDLSKASNMGRSYPSTYQESLAASRKASINMLEVNFRGPATSTVSGAVSGLQ